MTTLKTPVDGAKYFLSKGRPIFPLGYHAKVPPKDSTGLRDASTTEPNTLNQWLLTYPGCNWGYCPAMGGETVIDLDNHKDKNGEKNLFDWLKEIGRTLPPTFTVRTPTGGKHLYFKGALPTSKDNFKLGVDVHSAKAHVVVPGSVVKAGAYTIEDDREPAELPVWFVEAFSSQVSYRKIEKNMDASFSLIVTPDSEENIARAVKIITNWPETFEGARNQQLHQMMREVCKCGVTPTRAKELYYEYGVERLHYGADESEYREIEKTIDSSYGDMSDFGSNSHEVSMHMLETPEDADTPETWDSLAALDIPPRKWLVRDWLLADPGTVLLFTGRGGTGKSLIALKLCYCLATGEPWLGQEVLHRAKTMFVTCEDSRDEVARRVQKIAAASGKKHVDDRLIKVWSRQGKNNLLAIQGAGGSVASGTFFGRLKHECEKHFANDGGILVLDTVSDFSSIDENNRTQVSQFVKTILSDLAVSTGTSIILLAHPNKTGASYSGSTAWEGSVRSSWFLKWKDQDKDKNDKIGGPLVLQLSKSNTTIAGKEIVLEYDNNFLPRKVESGVQENEEKKDVIVAMIAEAVKNGNPFGRSIQAARPIVHAEIIDPDTGIQLEPEEIKSLVNDLLAKGRIVLKKTNKQTYLAPCDPDEAPPAPQG